MNKTGEGVTGVQGMEYRFDEAARARLARGAGEFYTPAPCLGEHPGTGCTNECWARAFGAKEKWTKMLRAGGADTSMDEKWQ